MADKKQSGDEQRPERPSEPESTPIASSINTREEADASRAVFPPQPPGSPGGPPFKVDASVALSKAFVAPTDDAALWGAIRNRTAAIRGDRYSDFVTNVLCGEKPAGTAVCLEKDDRYQIDDVFKKDPNSIELSIEAKRRELLGSTSGYGVDAYNLLKYATQAFLLLEAGVVISNPRFPRNEGENDMLDFVPGEDSRIGGPITFNDLNERLSRYLIGIGASLPYLDRILAALGSSPELLSPFCENALTHRFSCPSMLELIWSYWHEEGMLVQTMNAICMRFQNRRGPLERDPLADLEIDPLRPLNNLLWGYIQDEYNRLTVPRRAYEYDHHYGLKMVGKAVPELRSADSRSKFIEAFHNLLYCTAAF